MLRTAHVGRFVIIAGLVLSVMGASVSDSRASEIFIRDLLLSLAHPSGMPIEMETGNIDKVLAIPLEPSQAKYRNISGIFPRIPFSVEYLAEVEKNGRDRREFFESQWFVPGTSMRLTESPWAMMASLNPMVPSAARHGAGMLDPEALVSSTGELAGNPGRAFSRLEIRVDRRNFDVKLIAIPTSRSEEPKLIYQCKAGLGSTEYPTPSGSYYILRIFDKKPLWIPPTNRPWAWGQLPSNSVYGGHMMPFFKKRPTKGSARSAAPNQGLDRVAPKMKLVDAGMYRIHGTNSPWSVGSRQSHGCVRLLNSSVKKLSDSLKLYVGTTTRGRTANGEYVSLAKPVRLVLY
jgi:L,D-transpeptidase catalytic domain